MKSNKLKIPFGLHLTFDAYNCDPLKMNNFELVYQVLDKLPDKIGMHKLTRPYVVFADGNGKKDPGGWSGFIIIQESHISVHTFIKRRFVTADVYSCKEFDAKIAINYLKRAFLAKEVETELIIRGKKYPHKNID
jgi:S-adenosylmethionine decarboxylase